LDRKRLILALSTMLPTQLATELVEDFLIVRQDFSNKTLGRSSPGKFVETIVQCLQHLARGSHDPKPNVEKYLNCNVENENALPDDLRVCAARICRSIYTLRSRRNIVHKGIVDPNIYDLAYLHHAASWVLAEFLRHAKGIKMAEAGSLIAQIHAPIDEIVEDIDGVRLVHADVSLGEEVILLLRSHYPDYVSLAAVKLSLVGRNQGTLGNRLRELVDKKVIFGSPKTGYRLTQAGFKDAAEIGKRLAVAA
jgi:hypothetical protein